MRYQILLTRTASGLGTDFEKAATSLAKLVDQAILDGWRPLGGLAVGANGSTLEPYLFQAMTHE